MEAMREAARIAQEKMGEAAMVAMDVHLSPSSVVMKQPAPLQARFSFSSAARAVFFVSGRA